MLEYFCIFIWLRDIFRDLLDEARTYHLIPERRALMQSFKIEPRACDVKGYIYVVGGLNKHGRSFQFRLNFGVSIY